MQTTFGGFPAFEIEFDTTGQLVDPNAEAEALTYFDVGGPGAALTDIFVIAHGWNNDIAEARLLYGNFFAAVSAVRSKVDLPQRDFGVVALFWPSKRFADADLIAGGAAGVAGLADARLAAQLDRLEEVFAADPTSAAKIAHARTLLPALEANVAAQDDFVATLVSMVPPSRFAPDEGLEEARDALGTTPGHLVLQRLSVPFMPPTPAPVAGSGGATAFGLPGPQGAASGAPLPGTGSAAGWLGDIGGGIKNAASNVGNLITYYTMKDRAGIVGRTGGVATVRKLRALRSADAAPKVHLIGHSFGGRLVTALANELTAQDRDRVESLTLLEAAYSHNGLANDWDGTNDGAFRSVIAQRKVRGPVLITHSANDYPVGTAYPLASRLANQVAASLFGGPTDKFGGMGRNGAQHTPEAIDSRLQPVGAAYDPPLSDTLFVRNLCGDGPLPAPTIAGHGDVAKPEIAYALLAHIA